MALARRRRFARETPPDGDCDSDTSLRVVLNRAIHKSEESVANNARYDQSGTSTDKPPHDNAPDENPKTECHNSPGNEQAEVLRMRLLEKSAS